jgi:antitoxin HicB
MTNNPHAGSAFDDFLREEGLYEECSEIAIKRVLARQLAEEMKQKKITKTEMATKMQTSRAQLVKWTRRTGQLERDHKL